MKKMLGTIETFDLNPSTGRKAWCCSDEAYDISERLYNGSTVTEAERQGLASEVAQLTGKGHQCLGVSLWLAYTVKYVRDLL